MLATASPPWAELQDVFLVEVFCRSESKATRAVYGGILRRFLARWPDPATVVPPQVHAFAYGLVRGRSPRASTIATRLACLTSWYRFLLRQGAVERNPADSTLVRRPVVHQAPPKGLDEGQVGRLLASLPGDVRGLRDRAVILAYVLTGMRRAELLSLKAGALRLVGGEVTYQVRVKGGQTRQRRLPPPAYAALADYLAAAERPLERLKAGERLFPLSGSGMLKMVRTRGAAAGLGRIDVHCLRHAAAQLQHEAGAKLEEVCAFLGHSSVATTAHYLRRLIPQDAGRWEAVAAKILPAPEGEDGQDSGHTQDHPWDVAGRRGRDVGQ